MNEAIRHIGIFHAWDNPGYSTDELRRWMANGKDFRDLPDLLNYQQARNLLMASQKLIMANMVYPTIDRLVITSQTGVPSDNETSYSGLIYTAGSTEEFTRTGGVNPYTVGWNINSPSANGTWGSFVLINSDGQMLNRAIAGVTKNSNTSKLIVFTGSVI